MDSEVKNIVF